MCKFIYRDGVGISDVAVRPKFGKIVLVSHDVDYM